MPIVQMCKKILMSEANFNIVLMANKAAGMLATRIRKPFHVCAKILFGLILDKFKDKKTLMITETHQTLQAFFYCVNLEDVHEHILKALQDKNNSLKLNVIEYLEK